MLLTKKITPPLSAKKGIKEGFVGQKMIVLPPNIKRVMITNPLISTFYVTAIGYYPKAYHHNRERKNGSNEYILLYCIEGEGTILLNDTEYKLKPNTYFVVPKNVPHHYMSDTYNPWSIYWVHFSGDAAPLIYNRCLVNDQPTLHAIPYDENRIILFDRICFILEHSYNQREMEILNFNLLNFITSFIYDKELNPTIDNTDIVGNSIEFMKKNLNGQFTIEELARQQKISVSHYSKVVKQKTGSSPINYFNQLKVQKACQYLYFTSRSIKEIAAELGFEDQYYFSRLFRKIIDVSPANYRKRHKK
jgi:AraC family transcriptional regulator of arabinose operon